MASLTGEPIEDKNLNEFSKRLYSIWKKDEQLSTSNEEEQTNGTYSKKAKRNDD
jgi:hypothetical protein